MTLPRHIFDEVKGLYLVFPDAMVISNLKQDVIGNSATILFSVSIKTDPDSLQQFPSARPLRLLDIRFNLKAPVDPRINSFDFVKLTPQSGNVILTCDLSVVETILEMITSDVSFLSPEYRATSEEYSGHVVIAQSELSIEQIEHLDSASIGEDQNNMAKFVLILVELISQSSTSFGREAELASQALNRYASIQRRDSNAVDNDYEKNGWWEVSFPENLPIELKITEIQTKTDFVISRSTNLHVILA